MGRLVGPAGGGAGQRQAAQRLDDWIHEDNTVRVIDVFVDELDLGKLGLERAEPAATGRPAYSQATLHTIYVYGYLNRVQSSPRLETEAQRNLELMWLTGRLTPALKTIADFRRDNGEAIRKVCKEFVLLCRRMKLFTDGIVAIDGSKFTSALGLRSRYSGVFVTPEAAPASMRSNGTSSNCAVRTTLRTLINEMRPQSFNMAWSSRAIRGS